MSWWEALILGIIQGLTEFLPVSSSGHLEIGQVLLGTASEENLTFAVVVHTATVLSTLVILWHEVAWLLKGTFTTTKWNAEKDYAAKIIISMIPVFIVGMFFKEQVEAFFGNGLLVVGICLCVTAVLLWLSEYISKYRQEKVLAQLVQTRGTTTNNADLVAESKETGSDVTYWSAFVIGLSQAVAVLPGLSRSGTTIATGLLCGVKKSQVAQFSFLMVMIPILGEAFLDLVKMLTEPATTSNSISIVVLIVGFLASFITGCFACKFMINIVKKQKLIYFAIYCLLAGLFAITYQLCSVA